jgi:hypothetical protein
LIVIGEALVRQWLVGGEGCHWLQLVLEMLENQLRLIRLLQLLQLVWLLRLVRLMRLL